MQPIGAFIEINTPLYEIRQSLGLRRTIRIKFDLMPVNYCFCCSFPGGAVSESAMGFGKKCRAVSDCCRVKLIHRINRVWITRRGCRVFRLMKYAEDGGQA